jgi:PIN domain nuclease of toxin-antitoxin system
VAKTDLGADRLLLDTHALIWWAVGHSSLSRKVKRMIASDRSTVVVSAASAWEIATKVRLGKLRWPDDQSVEGYCIGQGFRLLSVTCRHAEKAGGWPQTHGDPFDRMLAAQSELEQIPLATNDPQIQVFGIRTLW